MTKVVLVGWDSADPDVVRELIAAGHMPCLARIIGAGSFGTLDSYEPYLSPMLWATIATGKDPEQHGIHGFAAIDAATGNAVPTSPAARRTKALWTLLSEQGKRCCVVGWLGSHPAEPVHGTYVADSFARHTRGDQTHPPPPPGSVYPPERADDLAELRLAPADVDPGLLGLFLPRLREIDLKTDPRPGKLLEHLAELYTLHNVAVTLAAENQPDFLTVYFHFLDWVSHVFMPFHPPRMAGVNERDFELYQHVVSGAYRLQDLLLADLLRNCAADTNLVLVSDHGFASGAHRPAHTPHVAAGIAAWHRPQGIFAASGPAFLPQSRPQGAALADITPTILALFGLPRGEDMPGRVLAETFAAAAPLRTIPSWESSAPFALPPTLPAGSDAGGDALLRQFVQLGYLDASLLDSQTASESGEEARRQNQWNLGVALVAWGHLERALPHLHEAFLAEPESAQYAFHLARCLLLLGLTDEAALVAGPLEDRGDGHPRACHLRAELALLSGRFTSVLTLAAVGRRDPSLARDCDRLTRTALIRLRRFPEARTSFEAALSSEPRHALLHAGLALINFHQRDTAAAEASARLALDLNPQLSLAKRVLNAVSQRRGISRPVRPELTWPELTARALRRHRLREEFHHRERQWLENKLESRRGLYPATSVPRQREAPAAPAVSSQDDFHLIVSGAPRSGTSLMMRMLAMAGMPVLTDGVRPPDDHNPHGYFEWEPAKQLPRDPHVIAEAAGQAVKVVSPLLQHLPANRRYRVIFMRRDVGEISRSQQTMLGQSAAPGNSAPLTVELGLHIRQTLVWAKSAAHIDLLEVSFASLISGDSAVFARIAEFVGPGRLKRPEAMPRAVSPRSVGSLLAVTPPASPNLLPVASENTVRPPWPDELRRLLKHLPVGLPRVAHPAWQWVIVAGETGRLVGAARLGENRPGQGRLELSVRSAWSKQPAAAELIRNALAQAVPLGLATVTAQVTPDSPLAAHLLAQGFEVLSCHEVWSLPVSAALVARLPTVERTLQRNPLKANPLDEHSLAAARLVCSTLELLEPERVQLQATLGAGVDPRFSFYVGDASQPSGVVLCRRLESRLYLEVLARNPAAVDPPRATVGALLRAVFLAARAAGIEEVHCAVTPAKAGPVMALMRRGGGSCVSRHEILAWRRPG